MKNDSNNRVPANKHSFVPKSGMDSVYFMLGIGGYLALPSIIIYVGPLSICYPRSINIRFREPGRKAGSPRPWELSEAYNTKSIPERYLPRFEELGTVAYVIIQDNRLLFEQYWEDYSPESHSNSFSMAKSIVSLAIGCAIDDGFIRNVDQPVSDFSRNSRDTTERPNASPFADHERRRGFRRGLQPPTTQLYYGDDLQEIAFG